MQCRFWTKCSFSCGTFGNHSPRPERLNGWSWMRSWRKPPQVSEWAWLRGRRSWRRWILARDTGTLVPMATCMPLENVEEQCRHVLFMKKKSCDFKLILSRWVGAMSAVPASVARATASTPTTAPPTRWTAPTGPSICGDFRPTTSEEVKRKIYTVIVAL